MYLVMFFVIPPPAKKNKHLKKGEDKLISRKIQAECPKLLESSVQSG